MKYFSKPLIGLFVLVLVFGCNVKNQDIGSGDLDAAISAAMQDDNIEVSKSQLRSGCRVGGRVKRPILLEIKFF